MAQVARLQAVDADTDKVKYTMEVTEARASEAVKWAGKFGYDVVDFYVTFYEPDTHNIVVYLRKKKKKK
jgi:hypothetical protein